MIKEKMMMAKRMTEWQMKSVNAMMKLTAYVKLRLAERTQTMMPMRISLAAQPEEKRETLREGLHMRIETKWREWMMNVSEMMSIIMSLTMAMKMKTDWQTKAQVKELVMKSA